jgi:hypothetical protein
VNLEGATTKVAPSAFSALGVFSVSARLAESLTGAAPLPPSVAGTEEERPGPARKIA